MVGHTHKIEWLRS